VADAKAEDIQELLGGALFKALYKWMIESGPVYLLPTGENTPALLHFHAGIPALLLILRDVTEQKKRAWLSF
jgi:hypothetical protein